MRDPDAIPQRSRWTAASHLICCSEKTDSGPATVPRNQGADSTQIVCENGGSTCMARKRVGPMHPPALAWAPSLADSHRDWKGLRPRKSAQNPPELLSPLTHSKMTVGR